MPIIEAIFEFILQPEVMLAIAGLIGAISYGIKIFFETKRIRAENDKLRAEVDTIHAQAEADDQQQENRQITMLIQLFAENLKSDQAIHKETNVILTEYRQELASIRLVNTDVKDAISLNTQALHDVKNWAAANESTVSVLAGKISEVHAAVTEGNRQHQEMSDKLSRLIEFHEPDPTEPDDQPATSRTGAQLKIADGAKDDATVSGESEAPAA